MRLPGIKQKDLVKSIRVSGKAKTINQMYGGVQYAYGRISLINFVKGKEEPRKQKGIKVGSRKGFRYEVRPGKVQSSGNKFIAKGKNNNYHVFYRPSDSKGRYDRAKRSNTALLIVNNTAPSPAQQLNDSPQLPSLMKGMGRKLQIEYKIDTNTGTVIFTYYNIVDTISTSFD